MKSKTGIAIALGLIATIAIGKMVHKKITAPKEIDLYTTEKPLSRTISQEIKATGHLEAADTLKIGSLVLGVVRKMYVEENQYVTKGTLLVEINDGLDDTVVRETLYAFKKSEAELVYKEAFFNRQEALYLGQNISKDAYEKARQDFYAAQADMESKRGTFDKATLAFNNKKIYAPENGVVIAKNVSEGETVALTSPATIIYTIASNIKNMQAKLEIDESVVGNLKKNATAMIVIDAFPTQECLQCVVTEISNNPIKYDGAVSYLATVPIDNSEKLFKPGMTVEAHIITTEKTNVLTVPNNIFKINRTIIKQIAAILGYNVEELDEATRHAFKFKNSTKSLWVKEKNSFVEKKVELGITDNAYFEIIEGLTGNEDVVVNTAEPDAMKQFFQKFFSKGM